MEKLNLGGIIIAENKKTLNVHPKKTCGFGLGGNIKTSFNDFIVEEVWANHICKVNYQISTRIMDRWRSQFQTKKSYLHFTLVKQNWDTIGALNYIGRKIGASLKRFGISGMKDKKAITAQRVSLWKADIHLVTRLNLKDLVLKDFKYAEDRITLGSASGNQFTITIHNIPQDKKKIFDIINQFREIVTRNGIPNFYGSQRFGGQNVAVGEALKNGDLKKAADLILQKVQAFLKEGTLENIPNVFWYEKNMLRHLTRFPNDYAGALRKIPKKILNIYVHSYQSKMFNDVLQRALTETKIPRMISIPGFNVPRMPELNTFQIERQSYMKAKQFKIIKIKQNTIILKFILNNGEYATTLLSCLID